MYLPSSSLIKNFIWDWCRVTALFHSTTLSHPRSFEESQPFSRCWNPKVDQKDNWRTYFLTVLTGTTVLTFASGDTISQNQQMMRILWNHRKAKKDIGDTTQQQIEPFIQDFFHCTDGSLVSLSTLTVEDYSHPADPLVNLNYIWNHISIKVSYVTPFNKLLTPQYSPKHWRFNFWCHNLKKKRQPTPVWQPFNYNILAPFFSDWQAAWCYKQSSQLVGQVTLFYRSKPTLRRPVFTIATNARLSTR